jgi:hypothetical protein
VKKEDSLACASGLYEKGLGAVQFGSPHRASSYERANRCGEYGIILAFFTAVADEGNVDFRTECITD